MCPGRRIICVESGPNLVPEAVLSNLLEGVDLQHSAVVRLPNGRDLLVERKSDGNHPLSRDPHTFRDDRLFIIACDDTYAPKQYFDFPGSKCMWCPPPTGHRMHKRSSTVHVALSNPCFELARARGGSKSRPEAATFPAATQHWSFRYGSPCAGRRCRRSFRGS